MRKSRKKKVFLTIFISFITIITTILTIYFSTNIIQKHMIRMMCKDIPSSIPENYEDILEKTTLKEVNYAYNVKLDIIEPLNVSEDALCVIYFHGGYYVGGGRHNQEPFARVIASYGYRVFNVDYSLAPEYIYPTQLRQASMALSYALTHYPLTRGFVLSGDSAGAHLSAQLSAFIYNSSSFKDKDFKSPIEPEQLLGFVGNCGFYQASTVEKTGFPLIGNAMQMLIGQRNYKKSKIIEEMDLFNFVLSFPKTLLICGDKDPFISQNKQFANLLTANGIYAEKYFPVSSENELGHEFQCNYSFKESIIVENRIIGFLKTL